MTAPASVRLLAHQRAALVVAERLLAEARAIHQQAGSEVSATLQAPTAAHTAAVATLRAAQAHHDGLIRLVFGLERRVAELSATSGNAQQSEVQRV